MALQCAKAAFHTFTLLTAHVLLVLNVQDSWIMIRDMIYLVELLFPYYIMRVCGFQLSEYTEL